MHDAALSMGVPKLKMLCGRTAIVATMENSPITLFPRGCDGLWEERLLVGPCWYFQDYLSPSRVCGRMHVGGSTNPMEMSGLYWLSRLSGRRGELFSRNAVGTSEHYSKTEDRSGTLAIATTNTTFPAGYYCSTSASYSAATVLSPDNRDHPHVRNWNAPFEALFNQLPRSAERDIVINQQDLIDCIRFIYLQ